MQIKLLDKDNIGIFFHFKPEIVNKVKSLPGARYEPKARFWYIPMDGITHISVKQLAEFGFAVDGEVYTWLEKLATPISQNFAFFTGQIPENLPLYDYQRETAQFMISTGSCLNANFVGSGKTLTLLAACEGLYAKKTLIIAPKSVVMQWATIEIPKWLPHKKVVAIMGTKKERDKLFREAKSADYVVIGYETARTNIQELQALGKFDVICADEVHRLASTTTQLYKALSKMASKVKYGLSATPVMNKPEDLFGIINWLRPNVLGSWYQFMQRYTVKGGFQLRQVVGNKNLDELAERVKPFVIKKTLEEVGMQLPDYTEQDLPVTLSPVERKNYDLIKAEMLHDIEPAIIKKIDNPVMLQNVVVKLGKLFELCDHMSLLGTSNDSSKLEVLKEHLQERLANGEKAIIITRFSRMAEILTRELSAYSPLLITGGTSNRATIIQEFETAAEKRVLIGTEAIGQGLNLQMANVLYNYDSAWNPARMEQRAGRIYRNGQDKPVFIYNLVVQRSVEQWLQKKLIKKQELSDRLLPKTLVEVKEMLEYA